MSGIILKLAISSPVISLVRLIKYLNPNSLKLGKANL